VSKLIHTYWGRQIDNLAHELSKLAIACDIELGRPGLAERILKNDETVCRRRNPKAFRLLRQHLMALRSVEEHAIEELGPEDTRKIFDEVRAAINSIRHTGSNATNLTKFFR
jgi:hypothetical protein